MGTCPARSGHTDRSITCACPGRASSSRTRPVWPHPSRRHPARARPVGYFAGRADGAATVLALGGGMAPAAPALMDSVSAAAESCSKSTGGARGECVSTAAHNETRHPSSAHGPAAPSPGATRSPASRRATPTATPCRRCEPTRDQDRTPGPPRRPQVGANDQNRHSAAFAARLCWTQARPIGPSRIVQLPGSLNLLDGQVERPAFERLQYVAELLPGEAPAIDHHVVAWPAVPPDQPAVDLPSRM